jgi:ubiquinone/menaquinone biosynthesis C-methylase UbiE
MKNSTNIDNPVHISEPWRTAPIGKNFARRRRDGDILARLNPNPLSLQCRNALHGHLEMGLMFSLLDIPTGKRVLQVGCGSGVALPYLSRLCRPCALTGIDIDTALLGDSHDRLREEQIDVQLLEADVRDMPFPDRSFDVVVDFGLCYHVKRPDAALREIARVLDSCGTLVYETPLAQLLAHPRTDIKRLPWQAAPSLGSRRSRVFWATRENAISGES